jgi:hypothetical protein
VPFLPAHSHTHPHPHPHTHTHTHTHTVQRSSKMILRRRCGASDCLAWFFMASIALVLFLVCSILYGTRTENPSLPQVVQEVLPAGRCLCQQSTTFRCESCLDCAARPAMVANASQAQETWEFDHRRDGSDYGLGDDQCAAAFPGLFEDIERAKNFRKGRGPVTLANLTDFALSKGMVRAMLYDGQVRVPPGADSPASPAPR